MILSGLYLAAIIGAMLCMGLIDHRYKLALFYRWKQTLITVAIGVGLFSLWDAIGIALGVFFAGSSNYMLGIFLAPDYPLEELFFLTFLCYFSLIVYRFLEKSWQRI